MIAMVNKQYLQGRKISEQAGTQLGQFIRAKIASAMLADINSIERFLQVLELRKVVECSKLNDRDWVYSKASSVGMYESIDGHIWYYICEFL